MNTSSKTSRKIRRLRSDSAAAAVEAARRAHDIPPAPRGFSVSQAGRWREVCEQLCAAERDPATLALVAELVQAEHLAAKLAGAKKPTQRAEFDAAREAALRCVSALGLTPGSRRHRTWQNARALEAAVRARSPAPPPKLSPAACITDAELVAQFDATHTMLDPDPDDVRAARRRLQDAVIAEREALWKSERAGRERRYTGTSLGGVSAARQAFEDAWYAERAAARAGS